MDARAKKLAACLACATACIAVARARADAATWPDLSSGPLQDNSFLIEEAYNQEAGVVQNIVNGLWSRGSEDWLLTFTQEWPVPDQRHQFSYTLLQQWAGDPTKPDTGTVRSSSFPMKCARRIELTSASLAWRRAISATSSGT